MVVSAILRDLAVVLAIATGVAVLFGRLRLSVVAAFLVAGAILGPTGAGLVSEAGMVDALSEIGVVLLLFTVGLEISLSNLGKMRRQVLLAGGTQVGTTIALAAAVLALGGFSAPKAIFVGFVLSLSSTAIVLKVYSDRMEIDTSQGRTSFAILLFQDMAVIPMMLLIPSLNQWGSAQPYTVFLTLAKAGAGVTFLLLLARVLIPRLLREVIRLNSREILAMTVLLVVLGTAWLAYRWGLSLGMGAFLAGMVISESDYVHEIAAQILPFRDVFNGVFFISVGMLLDLPFLFRHAHLVLPAALGVVLLKAVTSGTAVRILKYPRRVAVITAVGLVQIGEFSFLLLSQGYQRKLISGTEYQYLLATTILTMIATPFLIDAAPWIGRTWERLVSCIFPHPPLEREEEDAARREAIENHVIIAGYGMNGKNLARVLRATRIPYLVVDMNERKVSEGRAAGEPIFFGDVHNPEILDRLGASRARILVVAISDPMATRRVVGVARRLGPDVHILVRTRYVADVDDLLALGADAVIPEEFETSVEIFARVLGQYQVPEHIIRQQEQIIRSGTYRLLRERTAPGSGEVLAEFEEFLRRKVIEVFYVSPESGWAGRTVEELPLGRDTGVLLLSILREDRAIVQPAATEILSAGDKLVLFGGHAPLATALSTLGRPRSR